MADRSNFNPEVLNMTRNKTNEATGSEPSERRIFRKGQRIRITGPAWFPFSFTYLVTSNSHSRPERMAAKVTPVQLEGATGRDSKHQLLHWRDVPALDLVGKEFSFEDVTITEL